MLPSLGYPIALILCACVCTIAYRLGAHFAAGAGAHVRAAATALSAFYLLVASFHVLAALHAFRLWIVLGLALAAAALPTIARHRARIVWWFHRSGDAPVAPPDPLRAVLGEDARAVRAMLGEFSASRLRVVLLLIGAAIVATRLLRSLVAPPLAWDCFLYHLVKPARWVQDGYALSENAPDGWGYLEYFPVAGDVPWGFAMLPVHGDALIGAAGVLVWCCVVLGGYALARTFGGARIPSAYAALAIGFIPAMVNISTSGYADTFVLAVFLLGGVFAARLAAEASTSNVVLASASFGLLASAKSSGVPSLALGFVFVVGMVLRSNTFRTLRERGVALFLGAIAATAIALPHFLKNTLATGSPFYPLTVTLAGHTLFEGNEELTLLYTGRLGNLMEPPHPLWSLFRMLVFPRNGDGSQYGGFGPGSVGIAILGAIGLAMILRRGSPSQGLETTPHSMRPAAVLLLTMAIVPFIAILSPSFLAHRTMWAGFLGRLLPALPATLAVFGARVDGRAARASWMLVLGSGFFLSIPKGFSRPDIFGMESVATYLTLAAAIVAALVFVARRRRLGSGALVLGTLLAVAALAGPLERLRSVLRYRIYATLTSQPPAFEIHRVNKGYAGAWRIWQAVDQSTPHVIAVTAGWDGIGHNWFRYGLFGSHLQNHVIYVSPTRNGEVIDTRRVEDLADASDPDVWIERLTKRGVDIVAAICPTPLERAWMEARPEHFELIAVSSDQQSAAYRFHPSGAETPSTDAR